MIEPSQALQLSFLEGPVGSWPLVLEHHPETIDSIFDIARYILIFIGLKEPQEDLTVVDVSVHQAVSLFLPLSLSRDYQLLQKSIGFHKDIGVYLFKI